MTILLIIAIVATVACMVMLTYRINIVAKKTDTAIKMADNTLEIRNLNTSFFTQHGEVRAVNDVSLDVRRAQITGIVGESGCGVPGRSRINLLWCG